MRSTSGLCFWRGMRSILRSSISPIALFIVGVVVDHISHWKQDLRIANAAYLNLAIAAVATIPVVASGLAAWQFALEGQRLRCTLLLRLVLGCTVSFLIWLVFRMQIRAKRHPKGNVTYRFIVEALSVLIVAVTGHLGGVLSGVVSSV